MKALKVILAIGFTVLEILLFINYYNVVNGTGEVKIAIIVAGWIAQWILYDKATDITHLSKLFSKPIGTSNFTPDYLGIFIDAMTFISAGLFLVSCVFRNQALFIIDVILILINIITSAKTIHRGVIGWWDR